MNGILSGALALNLMFQPGGYERKNSFSLGGLDYQTENVSALPAHSLDKGNFEENGVMSAADAVKDIPGAYLSIGQRNEKLIYLRGFEPRQIGILYDGIPICTPYDGYVDLGKLPISNVSKIEILNGADSASYGHNSIGGAVNIVTWKPEKQFEGGIQTGLAGKGDRTASINVGSKHRLWYFTLGGDFADSKGFFMSKNFSGAGNEDGGLRNNSDFIRRNASLKAGITPSEGHEYAFGVNTIDGTWGLPPGVYDSKPRFWRLTQWRKDTFYFWGGAKIAEEILLKTGIFLDKYFNIMDAYDDGSYAAQLKNSSFHSAYDDYSMGGSLKMDIKRIPKHDIAVSLAHKADTHREQDTSGAVWEKFQAESYSLGLEDVFHPEESLEISAGAGYDIQRPIYADGASLRSEAKAFNPRISAGWNFSDDIKLHIAVADKTRFPTLKELYSGYLDRNIPNPDLMLERAALYETGMAQTNLVFGLDADITVFYSNLTNLIVNSPVAGGKQQYQNIDKASYLGTEFRVNSQRSDPVSFDFSYSYLDAGNKSAGRSTDRLSDRPAHSIHLGSLAHIAEKWSLSFGGRWFSARYYQDTNTLVWGKMGDYWVADGKLSCVVAGGLSAEAGVRNIFDRNYETFYGYPQEGRAVSAGIKYWF